MLHSIGIRRIHQLADDMMETRESTGAMASSICSFQWKRYLIANNPPMPDKMRVEDVIEFRAYLHFCMPKRDSGVSK